MTERPHILSNGDPFKIGLSGADVRGGSVTATIETGAVPGDGQAYARSDAGWQLTVGGEVSRYEGTGTGDQLIVSIPYDVGDGPDFYEVEVLANETGTVEFCGAFTMNGAAGRGPTAALASFVATRADTIPRQQQLRMQFVGSDLMIYLRNAAATDIEWKATVRRKRKADF